jgi:hypothetical protein
MKDPHTQEPITGILMSQSTLFMKALHIQEAGPASKCTFQLSEMHPKATKSHKNHTQDTLLQTIMNQLYLLLQALRWRSEMR